MPPKKGTWQPTNPPEWRRVAAQNLEARRQAQPEPISAEDRERAVPEATRMAREAQQRLRERRGSQAPAAPGGDSDVDMVDAAALMTSQREYYRTGAGLTASTFEPQKAHVVRVRSTGAGALLSRAFTI